MNLQINSLTDVTIDGAPQGGVVDVLFNAASNGNEEIRPAMLDALIAREKNIITEAAAEQAAAIEKLTGRHAVASAEAKETADAAIAALKVALAASQEVSESRQATIDRLTAAQSDIAKRIKAKYGALLAAAGDLESEVNEAVKTLSEKDESDKQARRAALQAELDAMK